MASYNFNKEEMELSKFEEDIFFSSIFKSYFDKTKTLTNCSCN